MPTPAALQDQASIIAALKPQPTEVPDSYRLKRRMPAYMYPFSSDDRKISFDTHTTTGQQVTYVNSHLDCLVDVTSTDALVPSPDTNKIAFKSSALSAFERITVRTGTGKTLIDERDPISLANHLRLALSTDPELLKSMESEIHYHRDRPADEVGGLMSKEQILNPSVSKYTGAPVAGVPDKDNNFDNPAYNRGFHERQRDFASDCRDNSGIPMKPFAGKTQTVRLRIPLRALSDFLRALCDNGPVIHDRLMFDFYLSNGAFSPVTLGSVVSRVPAAGPPVVLPGNDQVAGGACTLSFNLSSPPRLYYEIVEFGPGAYESVAEELARGMTRELTYSNYEVQDNTPYLNQANGAVINHHLTTAGIAVKRVYAMCYPAGVMRGTGWPSVLVSGANGLTNVDFTIGGQKYYNNTVDTLSDHYENLLNAAYMGTGRECSIPFRDFKYVSRIMCFDISRLAYNSADPNAPMDIILNGVVQSQAGNVDVIFVVETLKKGVRHLSSGLFEWEVGPALVKV